MKVDRYVKDLFKKLDNCNFSSGNDNEYDDDYYLEQGSEPPRFAEYREARAKITDVFGNKKYEDVWDIITQDESDYCLKVNLRTSSEERYQRARKRGISTNQVGIFVIITTMMDKAATTVNVFRSADIILKLEK